MMKLLLLVCLLFMVVHAGPFDGFANATTVVFNTATNTSDTLINVFRNGTENFLNLIRNGNLIIADGTRLTIQAFNGFISDALRRGFITADEFIKLSIRFFALIFG